MTATEPNPTLILSHKKEVYLTHNSKLGPVFNGGIVLPLPGIAGQGVIDDRDALEYLGLTLLKHTEMLMPFIAQIQDPHARIELGHALVLAEEVSKECGYATPERKSGETPCLARFVEELSQGPRALVPAPRTAAKGGRK